MKTQLRFFTLLLILTTAWGCKKDADMGSTPDPTPVVTLEERLIKGGLSFYTGLTRENFQAQPSTKKDPSNLLTEKNVVDFEEAIKRGKVSIFTTSGINT